MKICLCVVFFYLKSSEKVILWSAAYLWNFSDKARGNCNFLQVLFSPDASKASDGDLGKRLGKVAVAEKPASARMVYRDSDLNLSPLDLVTPARTLYVVLLDSKHTDSFLACARIRLVPPVRAV